MTEITANKITAIPPRHLVDPVAFALAIIGGPLLVGILGAPALLIPTAAAALGGPIYVLIGTPVMLFALRHKASSPVLWALRALVTHLALFGSLFGLAVSADGNVDGSTMFLAFGTIFAPLWGAVSGSIYDRFVRDFYKTPF